MLRLAAEPETLEESGVRFRVIVAPGRYDFYWPTRASQPHPVSITSASNQASYLKDKETRAR